MHLRMMVFAVMAPIVSTNVAVAQSDAVARVLTQADAPVSIESYQAGYSEGGRYATRGIHHEVSFRNTTARDIRAVRIGLVSFSVFNQFLDRTNGISLDRIPPGGTDNGLWVATATASFAFLTGLAYVSAVRFADGEIWDADMETILTQIRQIEADFDASRLTEEPIKGGGG